MGAILIVLREIKSGGSTKTLGLYKELCNLGLLIDKEDLRQVVVKSTYLSH